MSKIVSRLSIKDSDIEAEKSVINSQMSIYTLRVFNKNSTQGVEITLTLDEMRLLRDMVCGVL